MRVVIIGALLMAGCVQKEDERICLDAPTQIEPGDMMACVHKWAYRLAGSRDPAETVAKAVATACNDVANYAADRLEAASPEQRTETYSGNMGVGESEALFRVVQARAGNCDIP